MKSREIAKGAVVPGVHPDEIEIDLQVVQRLLDQQFPEWAGLPLRRFPSYGTVNALFRLGAELCVRLPRLLDEVPTYAIEQIHKDTEWLPRLSPHLPALVPVVVGQGEPSEDYPYNWAVYQWLEGEPPRRATDALARELAAFITALQSIDPTGAPATMSRAQPLAAHDSATRAALTRLHGEIDVPAAMRAWERALQAPNWDKHPVWVHGDLLAANLLLHDGRLGAVLDWGSLCAGDPACDLMIAWSLLAPVRDEFCASLDLDDATFERGRGWALSQAVIALPYYLHTNPPMVTHARSAIAGVLADANNPTRASD
jgi:aminoglycoside phosphotransferase (APT) family kinase protein